MSEMNVKEETVADFEWPALFISIVPRITGSLSVISSSTIIFLIYRSEAKLTTIYHRIMFCMSICDIIGSTAMALTTIPMPKKMPLEEELGFEWPGGNRYGSTLSCNLQGFSFTFGTLAMFGLNAMLCFYYACSIAFQMKESNIRKYAQPIIYGLPLAVGLTFAVVPLFTDLMNPPTNFQKGYWCLPTTYPFGCTDEDTCLRGGKHVNLLEKREKALMYAAMVSVLIMVGSLLLVIGRVMRTGCLLRRQGIAERKQQNNIDDIFQRWEMINDDDDYDEGSDEIDDSFGLKRMPPLSHAGEGQISSSAKVKFRKRSLLRSSTFERVSRIQLDTKVVILQAILYILAFFGGLAWTFNNEIDVKAFKFGLVFVPSQGIFNLLIFLWHKIYNYKRQHRGTPACQVVRLLFTTPVQEACFVSRISLVLDDKFDTEGAVRDNDMPLRIPPFQIHQEMSEEDIMKMIKKSKFELTKSNSDNMDRCGISEGAEDDMLEDFPIDSSIANLGNVNDFDYDNTLSHVQELPPLSAKRIYRRRGTLNTSHTSNTTSGTGLTRSTATPHGISGRTIDNSNSFPISLRVSDSSVHDMPGQSLDPGTETHRSFFHHRERNSLHSIAASGNDNSANNNINSEFTSSSDDSFLRIRLALLKEEEQMSRNMQDKDTASSHCEDVTIGGLSGFSDLSVGARSSASIEKDFPLKSNSAKLSEHQGFHKISENQGFHRRTERTETAIDSECDSSCS